AERRLRIACPVAPPRPTLFLGFYTTWTSKPDNSRHKCQSGLVHLTRYFPAALSGEDQCCGLKPCVTVACGDVCPQVVCWRVQPLSPYCQSALHSSVPRPFHAK